MVTIITMWLKETLTDGQNQTIVNWVKVLRFADPSASAISHSDFVAA